MTEIVDPRIEQVKKDAEQNKELVATKYAFKGFGRSTESVQKIDNELKKGQQLITSVVTLINAEKNYNEIVKQYGYSSDKIVQKMIAEAYNNYIGAQNNYKKLRGEAKNRRDLSLKDILSYDQTLASEGNDKIKLSRSTKSASKIKKLNVKINTGNRVKTLDKIKPAGAKNRKVPSLSKIPTLERVASQRLYRLTQ